MGTLKNELVWSHSRDRLFRSCRRAYWFAYYGSWGGWDLRAPPEQRTAYVQKKLTSIPQWIGTRVHGAAEQAIGALCSSRPPDVEANVAQLRRQLQADIDGSRSGAWLQRPSKRVGFREHYYGEPADETTWTAATAEVERQVRGFYTNRLYQRLVAVPERVLEVEQLRRFWVGDAEVYVALDLLVDDGRGGVVVVDWKTGEQHDHHEVAGQLGVYGLYTTRQLGVPEDSVLTMYVNLRSGTETRHRVGPPEISKAEQEIREGVDSMRAQLTDPAQNVAELERFPPLPPGAPACVRCNFRGVCGRGNVAAPA